jgi:WD40 repeat protein
VHLPNPLFPSHAQPPFLRLLSRHLQILRHPPPRPSFTRRSVPIRLRSPMSGGRSVGFRLEQVQGRGEHFAILLAIPLPFVSCLLKLTKWYMMGGLAQVVATSGTDRLINIYDYRSIRPSSQSMTSKSRSITPPLLQLQGHSFAVRKLAWSPHRADILVRTHVPCRLHHSLRPVSIDREVELTRKLTVDGLAQASVSYDMTANVWSTNPPRVLATQTAHTEFVYGVAWSLYEYVSSFHYPSLLTRSV